MTTAPLSPLCDPKTLSAAISHHRWHGYKNEIIAIISIVAFLALSVFALYWVAFYSLETLPIAITLIGIGLKIVHSLFFHPCRLRANTHWEALALEQRIAEKIRTTSNPDRTTPIRARYEAIQEQSDAILEKINILFFTSAQTSANGVPQNYRALLEERPRNFDRLVTHEAVWMKLQDQYLEKRVEAIFLTYVLQNPTHQNTYQQEGVCLANREITHRALSQAFREEEPFFLFHSQEKCILRSALLAAHFPPSDSIPTHDTEQRANISFMHLFAPTASS